MCQSLNRTALNRGSRELYPLCKFLLHPTTSRFNTESDMSRASIGEVTKQFMEDYLKRAVLLSNLFIILIIPSGLRAQQGGYFQTNLVSNTAGVATNTDPQLLNPWGISILPGQDFWIANTNSGTSTR